MTNPCQECSTGWYTTDIKGAVAKMAPGARMAVLPKLFWLSSVVASGEPPQIWGEELPGQQESVATDWPKKIQEDVQEHFARPATLRRSIKAAQHRRSGVHVAVPQRLEEELTVDPRCQEHLVSYVLASSRTKKGSDPQRIQRKRSLHAAMCERELEENGKASCLVAESLRRLAAEKYRTDGHFILELLVKPSEVGCAPADCSVIFAADVAALSEILALGLADEICLRLAVKFAARFCWKPEEPVPLQELPLLIKDHLSDRARLAGLVEYLALCNSVGMLMQEPPLEVEDGGYPTERKMAKEEGLNLDAVLHKLTLPPADAAVLELLCQHCPSLSEQVLLSSGQLKLARKIERLKHPHAHHELPAPLSPIDHSPAGTASLDPLTLPSTVEVVLVSDAVTLERACLRARQGVLLELQTCAEKCGKERLEFRGLDAEWKPFEERRRDGCDRDGVNPVQSLDLPMLSMEPKLEELCAELCPLAATDCIGQSKYPMVTLSHACLCAGSEDGFCAFCLGRSMDKSQQCSRWDLRPFSDEQLNYAALDAWVLLALLGHIISKAWWCHLRYLDGLDLGFPGVAPVCTVEKVSTNAVEFKPCPTFAPRQGAPLQPQELAAFPVTDALKTLEPSAQEVGPKDVAVCKTVACTAFAASGLQRLAAAVECASARLTSSEETGVFPVSSVKCAWALGG
eukprot:Skav204353  [mRNA]  locus=scaffold866:15956:23035:+ [translate_table: standard]